MRHNLRNSNFVELFASEEFMKDHLARNIQPLEIHTESRREPTVPVPRASHLPMMALAILVVGYIFFKLS